MDAKTQVESMGRMHLPHLTQNTSEGNQSLPIGIALLFEPIFIANGTNDIRFETVAQRISNSRGATLIAAGDFKLQQIISINKNSLFSSHFAFPFSLCFFTKPFTCLTILGWKRCFIASSLVMSFGCFFAFAMESFQ